jgi:hypothetical protein
MEETATPLCTWETSLIFFYVASVITTAIVSVWATAVVSVAIKNQISQHQVRQLQYWQDRAMRAERSSWRGP